MNQKNLVAILGVAVVILLGTTIYFATINNVSQPTPAPVAKPSAQSVANQQSTTPPVDETASWQTYRNENYGFEIKYPSKYVISDYTNRDIPRSPIVVEHNNPIAIFTENGKGDLTAYIEWWDGENDHLNFNKSKPDFQVKIKEKYIVVDYTPGVNYVVSPELKKEWGKIISTFKIVE